MTLTCHFGDAQLQSTLAVFAAAARRVLGDALVSVTLHGSIVLGDLAPGYGDLDFLVVTRDELPESVCSELIAMRQPFRSGEHGSYGRMLEGAFLPRRLLDPAAGGRAVWWGTSGERLKDSSQLGWFASEVIRERGLVIWGEDIRAGIPRPGLEALRDEVRGLCRDLREHGRGGGLHSVDWLLMAARALLWLREERLASKSEAADWAATHATGAWRNALARAKEVRLHPELAEAEEVRRWLEGLTGLIQDARAELETASW